MTFKSRLDAVCATSVAALAALAMTSEPVAAADFETRAFVFSYMVSETHSAENARLLDLRLRRAVRAYCAATEPTPTSRLGCQRSLATTARNAISARSAASATS